MQGDDGAIVPFDRSIEDYGHTPNQKTCALAIMTREIENGKEKH